MSILSNMKLPSHFKIFLKNLSNFLKYFQNILIKLIKNTLKNCFNILQIFSKFTKYSIYIFCFIFCEHITFI